MHLTRSALSTDIRVAIIDDEPASRGVIRGLLKQQYPDAQIVGEADGVATGIGLLESTAPDLVLLDVQMEDGTGFDLLDRLQNRNFSVVFITAYDKFAVRAFRYHAMDYLLKPIVPEEFKDVIDRIRSTSHHHRERQIEQLLETASNKSFDQITLHTGNGLVFAKTEEILRLETYGNYAFVYLMNGERHLVPRNLKEFEEMLPEPDFFRIHQSHLINTSYVQKYDKDEGGHAIMKDGVKLPVARRRKEDFLKLLGK